MLLKLCEAFFKYLSNDIQIYMRVSKIILNIFAKDEHVRTHSILLEYG